MTRAQLVARMADAAGWPRAASDRALRAMLGGVRTALKRGDTVTLVGFGTFSVAKRKASTGRNPRSGEPMTIKASTQPKFKAGKGLKDSCN